MKTSTIETQEEMMKKKLFIAAIILVVIALLGIRVITTIQRVSEASAAKASLLGLSTQNITKSDRAKLKYIGTLDKGILVVAVHANSLAEQRGLKPNDVILSINGEPVENTQDYERILNKTLMQEAVTFHIKRASGEVRIRLASEYAAAYNHLGNAYLKDKKSDEAMSAYRKAIDLNPRFAEAYYNLGNVYAQRKEYDAAIKHYKKATDYRKDFREAYYKLGEVYAEQGEYDAAIKHYKKIINFSPTETIASDLKPVEVIQATQGEIKEQLALSGTIEPQTLVTVFSKVMGVIEQMKVDKGSRVQKDQILAVVEHEELTLQVEQAEAAVASAVAAHNQTVQLAKINIMSQVTQARAGLTAAEAALQQVHALAQTRTESQIEQAEAALTALQANLEKIRRGAREEERGQIRATVAQAEANFSNIQSNYERMQKLFEKHAISKQTLEGIQTQLNVAKEQLNAAQQQWKLVEKGAQKEDIEAMEAQVKQAEAGLKLARVQAEKQTWQKDIAMAEAQVEQARAALESAESLVKAKSWEAEIAATQTALTQAKVMRNLAKKHLADAFVKAPISGVISRRYLDKGNMAAPAAPLFELVDMDVVHADVSILEGDLAQVSVGDVAWVHLKALASPVQGRVTSISPTIDKMSRTAQVEISIENPKHLLKPGMFASVRIPTKVRPNAILLPRTAVVEGTTDGQKYIFVVKAGKVTKKPVVLGMMEGNIVEIIEGLQAGAKVVSTGQKNLHQGDFVQVVKVIGKL